MESVKQVIEHILDQSQFDLGRVEAARGHSSRSWASRPGEVISTDELRQLLGRNDPGALDPDGVKEARLICPEETISMLVVRLPVLLKDYLDAENDTIGHAFPTVSHDNANEATSIQADRLCAMSCITTSLIPCTSGLSWQDHHLRRHPSDSAIVSTGAGWSSQSRTGLERMCGGCRWRLRGAGTGVG